MRKNGADERAVGAAQTLKAIIEMFGKGNMTPSEERLRDELVMEYEEKLRKIEEAKKLIAEEDRNKKLGSMCTECDGDGYVRYINTKTGVISEGDGPCRVCDGRGWLPEGYDRTDELMTCPDCRGSGTLTWTGVGPKVQEPCTTCDSTGRVPMLATLKDEVRPTKHRKRAVPKVGSNV